MEENYKFQPMMKIALLTEICPDEIKDLIFQNMDVKKRTGQRHIQDDPRQNDLMGLQPS